MSKNTQLGNLVNGIYVDSTGKVGVGTTSPSYALQVSAATGTNVTPQINAVNTTTNGYGILRLTGASRGGIIDFYDTTTAQASIAGQGGVLSFYTNGDSSGTAKVTITQAGNVGIGTSSPSQLLEVNNATQSIIRNVSGTRTLQLESYAVDWNYLTSTGNNLAIKADGAYNTVFYTNGSERMRIASDGKVGIGTSSPQRQFVVSNGGAEGMEVSAGSGRATIISYNRSTSSWLPLVLTEGSSNVLIGTTSDNGYKLNVSGNIYASSNIYAVGGIGAQGNIYTDYGYGFGLNSNTQVAANGWNFYVSSSFSNYLRFFYGGTGVGSGSAKFQIDTGGGYTGLSDVNKKKDISLSTLGLAEIMQLKPSTFKFKDDEKQEEQIGFIAQEVKDIIPQAYYEDEEGDDKFIGLKQTAFIPVLVKAIQELKAEIDILKNK